MKWHIYSVANARGDELEPMVQEYAARIARKVPLEVRVFPDEEKLVRAIGSGWVRILLHEKGTQPAGSVEFSRHLQDLLSRQSRDLVFVIGGAHGHSQVFLQTADEKLCLSHLTFPHRLARLVLMEQLYRALSIAAGEPYHHE